MAQKSEHESVESSHSSRGVTLVEMMVATLVLLLLGGAISVGLYNAQHSQTRQHDLMGAGRMARIAMNQLQAFLRQAGNDPTEIGFVPVTIDSADQITIRSDVTGAVAGATVLEATGDADGTLNNLHEQVVIRYDPALDQLFIDVGNGEELLARNVSSYALTFYDRAGAVTTTSADIARIHILMVVETDELDPQSGKPNTITLESDVMLRSQSFQLFAYDANQGHVTPGGGSTTTTSTTSTTTTTICGKKGC